jgi:hypothetical protein
VFKGQEFFPHGSVPGEYNILAQGPETGHNNFLKMPQMMIIKLKKCIETISQYAVSVTNLGKKHNTQEGPI